MIGVKTRSSDARYQSNSTNYSAKVVKHRGSAVNGSQKQVRTEDISKAKHSFEKESNVPSELLLHDSNIKNKYKVIEEMIVNYEDNNNDIIFPAKVSMESKKEMLEFVKNHSPRLSCMKITGIRSPSSRQEFTQKEILIFKLSLERLMQPNEYIDDDIVDGYMALLDKRQIEYSQVTKDKCLFFTTMWVPKYFNLSNQYAEAKMENIMFENVANWYDHMGDIFGYEKLFFPINIRNNHWALVVVYMQERVVQYYDSKLYDGELYVNAVLRYLELKWYKKDRDNISFNNMPWQTVSNTPNVPNQGQTVHCGMFMCLIADRIALNLDYSKLNPNILCQRGRWYMMSCINDDVLYL